MAGEGFKKTAIPATCPAYEKSQKGAGVYDNVFEIFHGQEYICTSAVPPPFCPSDNFPISSGKFTVQDDKNIYARSE